jgi:SPP1 family predicted phage head-tail adaptor
MAGGNGSTPPLMSPGRLNRRISIQQQASVQDAAGQPLQSWTEVYKCWANVDVQRSQLLYETAEFVGKNTLRITIRFTRAIVFNRGDRIQYTEAATNNTHTYEIQSILNPLQGNQWIVFLAYELDPQE